MTEGYTYYLDGYELNVVNEYKSEKITRAKVLNMADGRELLVPQKKGLEEFRLECWVDATEMSDFESFVNKLVDSEKPCEFVVNRQSPNGEMFLGTAIDVLISSSTGFLEKGSYGFGTKVNLYLKEYRGPDTKEVVQVSTERFSVKAEPERTKPLPELVVVEPEPVSEMDFIDLTNLELGYTQPAEHIKVANSTLWQAFDTPPAKSITARVVEWLLR